MNNDHIIETFPRIVFHNRQKGRQPRARSKAKKRTAFFQAFRQHQSVSGVIQVKGVTDFFLKEFRSQCSVQNTSDIETDFVLIVVARDGVGAHQKVFFFLRIRGERNAAAHELSGLECEALRLRNGEKHHAFIMTRHFRDGDSV